MADKIDYKLASPEQVAKDLGERLARIRLARNITQQELAQQAGIAERTLRRFEGGEGASFDTVIRLIQALDLAGHLATLLPDSRINPMANLGSTGAIGPGGTAKKEKPSREFLRPGKIQRARPKSVKKQEPWSWDDKETP